MSANQTGEYEPQPDVVCWNASALAGGPDVVWVWQVAYPAETQQFDTAPDLPEQLMLAMRDPRATSRMAIPGPTLEQPLFGALLTDFGQVVQVTGIEPGIVEIRTYEIDTDAPSADQAIEISMQSARLLRSIARRAERECGA
ncbi:hypothetical protein AB0H43_13100 [Hamadaea sp. NPDC050747]|uniref:hypothetical protein n=1 Tax=Hamadaea sp. NPDC050747 TaxID=3155789 RepID=UPI0033D55471